MWRAQSLVKCIVSIRKPKKTQVEENHLTIKVFGSSIEFATSLTNINDGFNVPKIVRDCITFLEDNGGISSMGIYRLCGSTSKMENLRRLYESPGFENVDLRNEQAGVDDVACLLKMYLRMLSKRIIPNSILQSLEKLVNEAEGVDDEQKTCTEIRNLLQLLSDTSYHTLWWLVTHLKHVIDNSEVNKMNEQNIAIVFFPCLSLLPSVLLALISHFSDIFPPYDPIRTDPQALPKRHATHDNPMLFQYFMAELESKEESLPLLCELVNQSHKCKSSCYFHLLTSQQCTVTSLRRKVRCIASDVGAVNHSPSERSSRQYSGHRHEPKTMIETQLSVTLPSGQNHVTSAAVRCDSGELLKPQKYSLRDMVRREEGEADESTIMMTQRLSRRLNNRSQGSQFGNSFNEFENFNKQQNFSDDKQKLVNFSTSSPNFRGDEP